MRAGRTEILTEVYDSLYVAADYVGEPQPVVEGDDEGRCVTGLGFSTEAEAERVLGPATPPGRPAAQAGAARGTYVPSSPADAAPVWMGGHEARPRRWIPGPSAL